MENKKSLDFEDNIDNDDEDDEIKLSYDLEIDSSLIVSNIYLYDENDDMVELGNKVQKIEITFEKSFKFLELTIQKLCCEITEFINVRTMINYMKGCKIFSFKKGDTKELSNINTDDEKHNVILLQIIPLQLKRTEIENYVHFN